MVLPPSAFPPSACLCACALTEQDDDAEQDGHQRPGAQPCPGRQCLGVTQLHVALAVAGADAHGERARAAVIGRVAVADDHRHLVDAAVQAAVAVAAGQDPGRVVCRDEAAKVSVNPVDPWSLCHWVSLCVCRTFVITHGEVGLPCRLLRQAEGEAVSSNWLVRIGGAHCLDSLQRDGQVRKQSAI